MKYWERIRNVKYFTVTRKKTICNVLLSTCEIDNFVFINLERNDLAAYFHFRE